MKPRRHKKNRDQQRMRPQFVDIVCALFKAYKNGPVPTRELERQLGYGVLGKMRIAPHIEKINDSGMVSIQSELRDDGYEGYVLLHIAGIDIEVLLEQSPSEETIFRLIQGGL